MTPTPLTEIAKIGSVTVCDHTIARIRTWAENRGLKQNYPARKQRLA